MSFNKWLILSSLCTISVSVDALKCEDAFHPWMSFQDAKAFIQTIKLTSMRHFQKWSKSGKRPKNFPSTPQRIYSKEWTNWGDFLGTRNISNHKKEWMSFQKARTFIQNLEIRSKEQFQKWSKSEQRPKNFPKHPERTYKEEWTNWGDFLGTGNISNKKKEWMSFQKAKTFIQKQGLKNRTEFEKWNKSGKRPKNFPSRPDRAYKGKWTNWPDFLRVRNISSHKKKWMNFQDAKTFIQKHKFKSTIQFQKWSKSEQRPKNFPSRPDQTYKNEWTNWGDFLGTENTSNNKKEWMSFQNAKTFIQNLGIRSKGKFQEWAKSGKRPKNFPSNPQRTYLDEWINWGDFLGKEPKTHITQRKQIESKSENILNDSDQTNQTDLAQPSDKKSILDRNEEQDSFNEIKTLLQQEIDNFHTEKEEQTNNESKTIPDNSDQRNNIGQKNHEKLKTEKKWMNFEEAKKYVQTLAFENPKNFIEWLKSDDRPVNFPPNPQQIYSEWTSVEDFLYKEIQEYMSYTEAKTFVQQLRITSLVDFFETKRNEPDIFPENFPPNPKGFYTNTGEWTDWNDFLGLEIKPQKKKKKKPSKKIQGFIERLESQDNTDENIEDDQNVEGDLTGDFTNEEPEVENYFSTND